MESNFRYFFKLSTKVVITTVLYGLMLALISFDNNILAGYAFGIAVMNIIFHVMLYKRDMILAISFGSTRKKLMKGLVFYDVSTLVLFDIVGIVIYIIWGILKNNIDISVLFGGVIPTLSGIALISTSVSIFLAVIINRFGKVVAAIVGFIVAITISLAVGLNVSLVADIILGNKFTISFVGVVIGVIVWLVALFLQSRIVRKITV